MKYIQVATIAIASSFLFSCSNDDAETTNNPLGAYDNGILILNEGNFGVDNGTISFLSNDFTTFQADAYKTVNNEAVGNTAQSIGFYGNLAFIVVNGSNKIEVINRYTLQKVATITNGLSNPRYIAFSNGKGFVTNWGDATLPTDDYVAVIDLSNYNVTATISVAEGPEKIQEQNGNLFVLHKGGYNYGNTISVIATSTNLVTNAITVGDIPSGIEEANGYLYVLCSGKPSWTGDETLAKLVKINPTDFSVTELTSFAPTQHPTNLAVEDNVVYYTLNNKVYKMNSTTATSDVLIDLAANQGFSYDYAYGFAVQNNTIFVADAKDFSANGKVYIYSLTGVLENEFEVKTSPNGFYFN